MKYVAFELVNSGQGGNKTELLSETAEEFIKSMCDYADCVFRKATDVEGDIAPYELLMDWHATARADAPLVRTKFETDDLIAVYHEDDFYEHVDDAADAFLERLVAATNEIDFEAARHSLPEGAKLVSCENDDGEPMLRAARPGETPLVPNVVFECGAPSRSCSA